MSKKQFRCLNVLFALALSIIAYNVQAPIGWDIIRHSDLINQIRYSGISLFDFLFRNSLDIGGSQYTELIIFNLFRYLVISFFKNNYILTAIFAFTNYLIIGEIIIDWRTDNPENPCFNLWLLLTIFGFMPYWGMVSGIRFSFSTVIAGAAIYLFLYKEKSIVIYIILMFIALTVHNGVVITIPFVILSKFSFKYNLGVYGIVFLVSFFSKNVAEFLIKTDVNYLQLIGNKYIVYTSEDQYRGSRYWLYSVELILLLLIILYLFERKKIIKSDLIPKRKKMIYEFIMLYSVYSLSNIGNFDMVLRPAHILSVLSPVVISLLTYDVYENGTINNVKLDKIVRIGVFVGCTLLLGFVNIMHFVRYYKYFIY